MLHEYAYLYDASGNRTSEQVDGNVVGSAYNSLNQMTGQSAGGKMVFSGNTGTIPSMVTVGGNAATTSYSTNFTGVASVTSGTNNVPIVAHDVNGNTSTNTYQVVIPATSASFTYDLNGNLTQDATRTYQWDAKNELTAIIYNSGTNAGNHTEFTYNGLGQRVAIIEKTGTAVGSGTVTSTRQYVFAGGIAEERNASNQVTKRYFAQGEQRISGGTTTNYFYTRDHLGSVREMIANDGSTIAARYEYDPYGRATLVSGSLSCDFQYAGMYEHATSGLNLTMFRAYDPNVGRWISRDPSGEGSGLNMYEYCGNSPICNTDVLGLDRTYFDRGKQFFGGTLSISLSYVEFLGAIGLTASGFVDGPVGPAAGAYAGTDAGIGILYGMLNMGAAFSPDDALAKTVEDLPASVAEAIARMTLGQEAQDLVSYADLTKDILHAKDRLEKIDDLLDLLNELNEAEDKFKYPDLQAPFAFPPSSCMDPMPAAFSETLHL